MLKKLTVRGEQIQVNDPRIDWIGWQQHTFRFAWDSENGEVYVEMIKTHESDHDGGTRRRKYIVRPLSKYYLEESEFMREMLVIDAYDNGDAEHCEWLVPVEWLVDLPRQAEDALVNPSFQKIADIFARVDKAWEDSRFKWQYYEPN